MFPTPAVPLSVWWPEVVDGRHVGQRKKENSLISLVIRSLWLDRYARVFDKVESNPQQLIRRISDEWQLWTSSRGLGRLEGEE
jgi:hypothetical protein